MTVNTTTITSGPYVGNGALDTYAYTFRVDDKSQLAIYETTDTLVETLLTVDTDYTVNNIGVDGGGTITRIAGNLPTDYQWYIKSNRADTQLTEFPSQGRFFPETHEKTFDHLTFLIQQLRDLIDERMFRLSDTIPIDGVFTIDDNAATRDGKFLGFDVAGNLALTLGPQLLIGDGVYDNVALMKAASPVVGLTLETRGYYTAGDGGGARYLTVAPQGFDGYVDHELTNSNIAVLQVEQQFRGESAGIIGDDTTNNDAAFVAAINFCSSVERNMHLGPGIFRATIIILLTWVRIIGAGTRGTILKALVSGETGFIQISIGPVQYSGLENLSVWGGDPSPVNAGQWGMYFDSVDDGGGSGGGLWLSPFTNVEVRYFDNGVWGKGGETGFLEPNQLQKWTDVYIFRYSNVGLSLKLTGQNGQMYFDHCIFGSLNNTFIGSGTLVELNKHTGGTNTPSNITFDQCSLANSATGFYLYNSASVDIKGCFLENMHYGINAEVTSETINILGCRFGNAASDGVSGGYAVRFGSASQGSFRDSYILGALDNICIGVSHTGVQISNIWTSVTATDGYTSGMTASVSIIADGSLAALSYTSIFVNAAFTLITINSRLLPGERITLFATGGDMSVATGGNIIFGSVSPITVKSGDFIELMRVDTGANAWRVVSVPPADTVTLLGYSASAGYVQAELQTLLDKVAELTTKLKEAGLVR